MRSTIIVFCLAIAACDRPLENMANECAVEGLKDVQAPEKAISCSNFSVNVAIARQMMIDKGWIKDEAEFNADYSSLTVNMYNKRCLSGGVGDCTYGQYMAADNFSPAYIDLNWDGKALAHEFMHHYDWTHGRGDTSYLHKDWDTLGYFKFADEYENAALDLN